MQAVHAGTKKSREVILADHTQNRSTVSAMPMPGEKSTELHDGLAVVLPEEGEAAAGRDETYVMEAESRMDVLCSEWEEASEDEPVYPDDWDRELVVRDQYTGLCWTVRLEEIAAWYGFDRCDLVDCIHGYGYAA